MRTSSLGILAHVDAGKTTLTERLLHAAGVIDAVGSVDAGTTQTDSMALERQRGITIRAAVVAFTVDDTTVNLIDTPGHPDFIAEVDRCLGVLDGAVLVVSAVEGVQPQTVVLARALHRRRVPTLVFVNKIDRPGADPERVVTTMRERLPTPVVPLGAARDAGTRGASYLPHDLAAGAAPDAVVEVLADRDEALLAAVLEDARGTVSHDLLLASLARQTAAAQVLPTVYGSALTGAGIGSLVHALSTLLPAAGGDPEAPATGSVFKVDRGPRGDRVAYVRMSTGRVHVRDRLHVGQHAATVTAVRVFEHGAAVDRGVVSAGQIATLSGLRDVRVGDVVGAASSSATASSFAPPALQTAVVARDPAQQGVLHAALAQLADQDPLIDLRQDDERGELFVSLFGEVQKEVIADTLRTDFGVLADFRDTTTICIERPVGTGSAVLRLGESAPFLATVGLALGPGPVGSGLDVRFAVGLTTIPLYVYGTVDAFHEAMTRYLTTSLRRGPSGWAVHDVVVTMTESGYSAPGTGAGDVRKVTAQVVREALARAGTVVCEPIDAFHLEAPTDALPAVLRLLGRHRGVPGPPSVSGRWCAVDGHVPAAEVHALQQELRGRTHGEGVLEVRLERYEPVAGAGPSVGQRRSVRTRRKPRAR